MIQIDLLEVFKTGVLNNLKVGTTKDWLKENFPEPDYIVEENYWKYGNMDFFFDKNKLIEICIRMIETLDGGKSITLNKWILEYPEKLTVTYVITKLLSENIDFTISHTKKIHPPDPSIGMDIEYYSLQSTIALINSSAYLIFQPEEPESEDPLWLSKQIQIDQNEYKLGGFSIFENLDSFYAVLDRKKNNLIQR